MQPAEFIILIIRTENKIFSLSINEKVKDILNQIRKQVILWVGDLNIDKMVNIKVNHHPSSYQYFQSSIHNVQNPNKNLILYYLFGF